MRREFNDILYGFGLFTVDQLKDRIEQAEQWAANNGPLSDEESGLLARAKLHYEDYKDGGPLA